MNLFEAVIYLTLTVMIVPLAGRVVLQTSLDSQKYRASLESAIAITCALFSLAKDLKKASKKEFRYMMATSTTCIFLLEDKACGWQLSKNRLMRYQGRYDGATDSWVNRSASTLVQSVAALEFRYIFRDGDLIGIEVHLISGSIGQKIFIALRGYDE